MKIFIPIIVFIHCCDTNNIFFGSKTEYDVAKSFISSPMNARKKSQKTRFYRNSLFPHFEVIALTAFSRHGSRSPTRKQINKVNKFCYKNNIKFDGMTEPCKSNWNSSFDGNLTKNGAQVEFRRGKWFKSNFPNLFNKSDTDQDFIQIITSFKPRAIESSKSFIRGLNSTLKTEHHIDNKIVRFYDKCKGQKKILESGIISKVFNNLSKKSQVVNILKRLERTLNCSVSLKEAILLYDICFSEKNNFDDSHFCQFFPHSAEIRILEAVHDIQKFWSNGRALEVNYLTSCVLFEKMFKFIKDSMENYKVESIRNKSLFIFGHAEGLLPLESLLGFFDSDFHIYNNSFIEEIMDNKFIARTAIPYSGNIAFVLTMKKFERIRDLMKPTFGILVLVNEFVIQVPFCKHTMCKWEEFTEFYKLIKHRTHNCDFDKLCENN